MEKSKGATVLKRWLTSKYRKREPMWTKESSSPSGVAGPTGFLERNLPAQFVLKTSLRIFFVFLPALCFLAYIEYGLSHVDTHYFSKRKYLEEQKNSIVVLTLGSSNAYFDINPAYFSYTGFNLAYNQQSSYYDWQFIEKYVDKLPNLKVVVLPAILIQLVTNLSIDGPAWRMFFYKQYYGLPLEETGLDLFHRIKYFFDPRNYTKIALYGDTVYSHFKHNFKDHNDYVVERTGWYDSTAVPPADLNRHVGPDGATSFNRVYNHDLLSINLVYWQHLVDRLKVRNIHVLIVHCPEHESYYKNLDSAKLEDFNGAITAFAKKNGLVFADYSQDDRFTLDDFTVMVDHMNPKGAAKFSKILNGDYIEPFCR